MRQFVFLFFLLSTISSTYAQKSVKQFPEDFLGHYKGELRYETSQGMQRIPMEFILRKTDSLLKYDYWLIYNNQPRKYSLLVKDADKGQFEIDENNGIILPARFFENTLLSWFEVNKNKVSSRLQFEEDTLIFEILFSYTQNKTTTGGTSDKIPQVFGYPIAAVQRAELIKKD